MIIYQLVSKRADNMSARLFIYKRKCPARRSRAGHLDQCRSGRKTRLGRYLVMRLINVRRIEVADDDMHEEKSAMDFKTVDCAGLGDSPGTLLEFNRTARTYHAPLRMLVSTEDMEFFTDLAVLVTPDGTDADEHQSLKMIADPPVERVDDRVVVLWVEPSLSSESSANIFLVRE